MNVRRIYFVKLMAMLLVFFSLNPGHASDKLETVTIQFKWFHQFQFAGYYAALEKGYYAREGLDVVLRERDPKTDHIEDVVKGIAQYGVADAGLLLSRLQGKPVVLLSQIFQHSPLVFLTLKESGIRTPYDLSGKIIMIDSDVHKYPALSALIKKTIGGTDKFTQIQETFRNEDMVEGKTDAMVAYVTDQPFWFKEMGGAVNVIDPRDYGIDFYGDNLFTTEQEIRAHPERVNKIKRATLKGWAYALEHPSEMVDLIFTKYNTRKFSREHLSHEAFETEKMIVPEFIMLGHFEHSRYQKIAETYVQLGLTNQSDVDERFYYKEETPQIQLNPEQIKWLEAHPQINIGIMNAWPPMDFVDANGKPRGIGVDYINALNKRLSDRLVIVPGPWKEIYERVKAKKLDALTGITPKAYRKPHFNFTKPYIKIPHSIVARQDGPYYQSTAELSGKTIALERGFFLVKSIQKNQPDTIIKEYDSTSEALEAVAKGEADAYIGNRAVATYTMEKELLGNLQIQGRNKGTFSVNAIGVRKDWPMLATILDRALASMTPEEKRAIHHKWGDTALSKKSTGSTDTRGINLTREEKEWLKNNPVIKANGGEWPPLIIRTEKGETTGISTQILNLATDMVDLKVEYVDGPWPKMVEMLKNQRIDLLQCVSKTPERDAFMHFTEPYLTQSDAIFVQRNDTSIRSIADLKGKKLAVNKASRLEELIAEQYPEISLSLVSSPKEGIKAVSSHKTTAYIGSLLVVESEIKKNLITNLKVAAYFDETAEDLRLGARHDYKILADILQKALALITEEQKQDILNRYALTSLQKGDVAVQQSSTTIDFYHAVAIGFIVFLMVGLLTLILLKILRKENIAVNFGSRWFRGLILSGLTLFVCIVILIGWYDLEQNKKHHLHDIDKQLRGLLSIEQDRLDLWLKERIAYMTRLGRDPELVAITNRLLAVDPSKERLLKSDALKRARSFFKKSEDIFSNIGFFIINPDYISIGSMRDTNVGIRNLIADEYPNLIQQAFQGKVGFVPPITSDVSLGDSSKTGKAKKPPTMFFIGPVKNIEGKVLAVMTLRVDPRKDFAETMTTFKNLSSGETYAFDRNGCLLTPSRFEDQLRHIGLLSENQRSPMNIEIRDPGGNLVEGYRPNRERSGQPLTYMASQTIALQQKMKLTKTDHGQSPVESTMEGYRDYRGVEVFGAWLWNADLNIGLAAEVDVHDALSRYNQTRVMIFSILGFTLFLSVGAILFVLIIGERTSRALLRSKEELEEKVAQRTVELKDNQERFASLLESAPDAMVVSNDNGDIVFVNSQTERLFGYKRSELLGHPVELLVPESKRVSHPVNRKRFMEDAAVRQMGAGMELSAQSKNGAIIPVDISLSPIKTTSGLLVVASIRDITERKAAEEAIRASEEKTRLVLECVGDGIFGVDLNGKVTFVNPVAGRLLGYDPDELIGQIVHEKIHHSHSDGSPYPVETCPMSKSYTHGTTETISDEMLWRKDGSGLSVEYTATPIKKGETITGAVIAFRDITQRIEAERAIKDSEDRLTLAAEAGGLGMWEWRVDLDRAIVSNYWLQLKGLTREAYNQSVDQWNDGLHPDDKEQATSLLTAHLNGDTEQFEAEYRFKHPERGWYWEYANARVIKRDEDGKPLRMVGYHQDISLRKKMESALTAERERLQGILDTSPVGVAFSTKGVIHFANPRFLEMFDVKVGDLSPNLYVHTEERDLLVEKLSTVGRVDNYELQLYGRSGQVRDMLVTYLPINIDGEDGILGWLQDVTERKKTEKEIKEKYEELTRFRKLAVGRETRMIELKKEINELLNESGKSQKYKIR